MSESEFSSMPVAATAAPEKKKKKRAGLALLVGGVAVTAAVGGVFAYTGTTISINSDGGIELGAGVSDVSSCTTSATSNITQSFDGTAFVVDTVTVSGVESCPAGTILTVRLGATGTTGDAACDLVAINNTATGPLGTSDAYFSLTGNTGDYNASPTGMTGCDPGTVGKVIITTSN